MFFLIWFTVFFNQSIFGLMLLTIYGRSTTSNAWIPLFLFRLPLVATVSTNPIDQQTPSRIASKIERRFLIAWYNRPGFASILSVLVYTWPSFPPIHLQIVNGRKSQDQFISHVYLISTEERKYKGGGRNSQ